MERMRKFLKFLSQRIVIVTFLIFLQIMWFVGMFLKVTSYSQYITAAFKILSILVVIYIMNRSDNPSVKLGWIVVILLFPLFGGLLYLTIGGKQPISYLRRKLEPMIEAGVERKGRQYGFADLLSGAPVRISRLQRLKGGLLSIR